MGKRKHKLGKKDKELSPAIDYSVEYRDKATGEKHKGYKLKSSYKRGYFNFSDLSEKQSYDLETTLAGLNELGQQKKRPQAEERAFGELAEKVNEMPEGKKAKIRKKILDFIAKDCIPKLPKLEKRVYKLLWEQRREQRTHEVIAVMLQKEGRNISRGNVSTIETRIIKKLTKWVKEKYPEESNYMPYLLSQSDGYPGKKSHQKQSG